MGLMMAEPHTLENSPVEVDNYVDFIPTQKNNRALFLNNNIKNAETV